MFKKSKRRSAQESKPSNKSLTRVVVSVLAVVLVWFGMVQVERYVLTDKAVASVIVASTDIPNGTLITEDNVANYFSTKEVNASLVTATSVSDITQLYGKALTDISSGEIITTNRIFNTAWVNEKYNNPVEISFTVKGAEAAVNGVLRAGDLVNVMTLTTDDSGNVTTQVLLSNVYLLNVYNSSSAEIASTDSSSLATGFTIYVEADQAEQVNGALATSSVYLAKLETKTDGSVESVDSIVDEAIPAEDADASADDNANTEVIDTEVDTEESTEVTAVDIVPED